MIWRRFVAHSFEVAVCVLLLAIGVFIVLVPGTENISYYRAIMIFGALWGSLWYLVLATGAALVLVALLVRSGITALLLERVGLVLVGWQLAIIGVLLQFVSGVDIEIRTDGLGCLVFAAGAAGRLVKVTHDLRSLRSVSTS